MERSDTIRRTQRPLNCIPFHSVGWLDLHIDFMLLPVISCAVLRSSWLVTSIMTALSLFSAQIHFMRANCETLNLPCNYSVHFSPHLATCQSHGSHIQVMVVHLPDYQIQRIWTTRTRSVEKHLVDLWIEVLSQFFQPIPIFESWSTKIYSYPWTRGSWKMSLVCKRLYRNLLTQAINIAKGVGILPSNCRNVKARKWYRIPYLWVW